MILTATWKGLFRGSSEEQRYREAKQLVQDHISSAWQSQDPNPRIWT